MGKNVSQQLIGTHLVEGRMEAGQEIGLRIDQTLTLDADARARGDASFPSQDRALRRIDTRMVLPDH
jgi:hypothetical protein